MSIKGFRITSDKDQVSFVDFYSVGHVTEEMFYTYFNVSDKYEGTDIKIQFDTGVCDREGTPIYEGDTLRQMSCEQTFKVEDIVSFLLMCGRYEAKHGTPIFDSLEVVTE